MAKKIFKGLLGIGGKKKAEAPVAEQKGPIVKQIGMAETEPRKRRQPAGFQGQIASSILSDKLGG